MTALCLRRVNHILADQGAAALDLQPRLPVTEDTVGAYDGGAIEEEDALSAAAVHPVLQSVLSHALKPLSSQCYHML